MEPESWKEDEEIRKHLDDLLLTLDEKFSVIMPLMKPYILPTQEWKMFLGLTFFINQYGNARNMDFSLDEAYTFALDLTLKLPYVTNLLETWIKDGMEMKKNV